MTGAPEAGRSTFQEARGSVRLKEDLPCIQRVNLNCWPRRDKRNALSLNITPNHHRSIVHL